MNAKKIVLLAAAGMMLASCGTSLTRADAIAKMGTIFAAEISATAVSYKWEAKATGNATGVVGYTVETYDSTAKYMYIGQELTVEDAEAAEMPLGKSEFGQWAYLKDNVFYAAMQEGQVAVYAKVSEAEDVVLPGLGSVFALLTGQIDAQLTGYITEILESTKASSNKNNPYGFCGFLNRFPEGDALYTEGTGTLPSCKIIGEKYTTTGEGNLSATYNAKYDGQEDEVYSAEWVNNRLVALSNAKTSSASGYGFKTWAYDEKVTPSYPDLTKFQEVSILDFLG